MTQTTRSGIVDIDTAAGTGTDDVGDAIVAVLEGEQEQEQQAEEEVAARLAFVLAAAVDHSTLAPRVQPDPGKQKDPYLDSATLSGQDQELQKSRAK